MNGQECPFYVSLILGVRRLRSCAGGLFFLSYGKVCVNNFVEKAESLKFWPIVPFGEFSFLKNDELKGCAPGSAFGQI